VGGISSTVYNLIVFLSAFLDIKLFFVQPHVVKKKIQSISSIYTSAVWLERENSEMFNINYNNLLDSRRLLLDYTTSRGVLLKNTTTRFVTHYYKLKANVNFFSD
jgi:NADH:ubiquinone oxidoreductase subunit C